MNLKSLPRVASNVYIPCDKCDREGSYCRVIAHTSPFTAKTQCEICQKTKRLQIASPTSTSVRAPKKAPVRQTTRSATLEKEWETLIGKYGPEGVIYSIKGLYTKDTVIDHPKFGRGVVTTSHKDRLEVLFKDGLKDLIQGRK